MIFVTVGSMLGFDRLIETMDAWAKEHPNDDILAQIGDGRYLPVNMRWTRLISPGEFKDLVRSSSLIVAHAGMGSFFVAMESQKPVVMMPRLAALQEHTTDHQLHTLRWLRAKPGVYAADTEADLGHAIDRAMRDVTVFDQFEPFASPPFVAKLREAILR